MGERGRKVRWIVVGLVVVAVAVAAVLVARRPGPTHTLVIRSVSRDHLCAYDFDDGQDKCWGYSDELSGPGGLTWGDCVKAFWVYADDKAPPHLEPTACPES